MLPNNERKPCKTIKSLFLNPSESWHCRTTKQPEIPGGLTKESWSKDGPSCGRTWGEDEASIQVGKKKSTSIRVCFLECRGSCTQREFPHTFRLYLTDVQLTLPRNTGGTAGRLPLGERMSHRCWKAWSPAPLVDPSLKRLNLLVEGQ